MSITPNLSRQRNRWLFFTENCALLDLLVVFHYNLRERCTLTHIQHEPPTPEEVAESSTWRIFLRNCVNAGLTKVLRPGDTMLGTSLADVFQVMQVDLAALSQIFVAKPWEYYDVPADQRPIQPTAPSYEALGSLRSYDLEGFAALAKLTGKDLRLYLRVGDEHMEMIDHALVTKTGEVDDSLTWIDPLLEYVQPLRDYLAWRTGDGATIRNLMSEARRAWGSAQEEVEFGGARRILLSTIFLAEISDAINKATTGIRNELRSAREAGYTLHRDRCLDLALDYVESLYPGNRLVDCDWLAQFWDRGVIR